MSQPLPRDDDDLAPRQFSAVFDNAPVGMAVVSAEGRRVRVNAAFCAMLGYSRTELLGNDMYAQTHPDDIAEGRREMALLLSGSKSTYVREKRLIDAAGKTVWVSFTCSVLPGAPGMPLQLITQVQDITERKMVEQALMDSEKRFRDMTRLSTDWYWEQDEDLRFTRFTGDRFKGAPRSDQLAAIGLRRWEGGGRWPVRGDWNEHRAVLEARLPFRDFEFVIHVEGQPPRYLCSSGEPTFDTKGRFSGYRGTARDVTAAHLAQAQARATSERLVLALESMADAFISFDRQWRFTYVNAHAERLLQRTREELLGGVIWELFPDADVGTFARHYRKAMDENVTVQSEEYHAGSGTWAQVKVYPSEQGLAIFYRDITESVLAEVEIRSLNAGLEERVKERTAQLEEANKELQFFAFSIAHDLRGPLSSMDGFSSMLASEPANVLTERSRHYILRIRAGVRTMAELTEALLAMAKLSRTELHDGDVDLAHLARYALSACRERSPGRKVDALVPDTLPARGDERLLAQVYGNLIDNAWKFTSQREAAFIEVGCLTGQEARAQDPEGNGPLYFVRDNGAGFDPAHASHLFEPFQRLHTAAQFEGTGIGLALVQKIIMRHRGRIWAEAEPDRGATFYFTLGTQ
jgi:PAS domain S-box-containing protein